MHLQLRWIHSNVLHFHNANQSHFFSSLNLLYYNLYRPIFANTRANCKRSNGAMVQKPKHMLSIGKTFDTYQTQCIVYLYIRIFLQLKHASFDTVSNSSLNLISHNVRHCKVKWRSKKIPLYI